MALPYPMSCSPVALAHRVIDDRRGGVLGTAGGHDVDLDEQAQRGDRDGDEDEDHCRVQARPGDVAEALPSVDAVEVGGLVENRVIICSPESQMINVEADRLPRWTAG